MSKKRKQEIDLSKIERFFPESHIGLSTDEIEKRKEQGATNKSDQKLGRGYGQIFVRHGLTFFNVMYVIITILLLVAAYIQRLKTNIPDADMIRWSDFMFLLIVSINTIIGIIQEIKSKITIDKLTLLNQPSVTVIRNGESQEIKIDEVVLDDIMYLNIGKEIVSDAILMEGSLEVNESQLTGESVAVVKKAGDILYSGSFVVSGSGYAQVEHVGKANEINKLTSQAKSYKRPHSVILGSLGIFLKVVAVILVITGISMLYLFMKEGADFSVAVKSTAAALIGMIPAGVYLITSVALALSAIKLAKKRTLVQDMYCIEMLARTDVLCLDKTGTLTDGTMSVVRFIDKREFEDDDFSEHPKIEDIISSLNRALSDSNATSKALVNYFGYSGIYKPKQVMAFSSERKYSVVDFENIGTYLFGAPEILLGKGFKKYASEVTEYAKQGLRVVALVSSKESGESVIKKGLTKIPTLEALILIEDQIRPDAFETVRYFKENGVQIKVISGDNPITVSEVARRVGVERANEYISLDGMSEEDVYQIANSYTVFGRVKPEQKKIIIKALKDKGNTVAMTGDGVNDIPALKAADCSIAMASGNDAVRKVAQLVLLDSNFSSMPEVVNEGRRVINNVERSASLFLVKTLFIILLAILTISGFIWRFAPEDGVTFPIGSTKQLLLLELFAIGIPSFYLAVQTDYTKIKGRFLYNVLKKALPGALAITIEVMIAYVFAEMLGISPEQIKTLSVLCATGTCLMVLYLAFRPFDIKKTILFIVLIGFVFVSIALSMSDITFKIPVFDIPINFYDIFGFKTLHEIIEIKNEVGVVIGKEVNSTALMLGIILIMFSYVLITSITTLISTIEKKFNDMKNGELFEFKKQGRTEDEFFLNRKRRKK